MKSVFAVVASKSQAHFVEHLRAIPAEFWWKTAVGILIVIAAVFVLRKIAGMNRLLLAVGVFLAVATVGFHWIYERNEPSWATPVVQLVSGFFPSKGRVF